MIIRAKQDYYIDTIKAAGNNTKKLFEISYSLLGRATTRILPDIPLQSMPIHFDTYFNNKITNIINSLPSPTLPQITISIYKFNTFNTPTLTTIDSLLQAVKSACKLDPIPTPLLHILSTRLTPHYKTIIDRSLTSGIVPT